MRTTWRRLVVFAPLLCCLATGCGSQTSFLAASGGLLFQGFDTLAYPRQTVTISARVQGGDFLKGLEGYLVGFHLLDHKIGEGRTNEDGLAQIEYTAPAKGNHVVLARLEDPDVRKYAVPAVEIIVAAREKTERMVIVDIDRTLVAGGFDEVLSGTAEPMTDSRRVLSAINKEHPVVYLTRRPDVYTSLTNRWLRKYDYPTGPLLTSTIASFLKGSRQFKTAALTELKASFPDIEYGIGDQVSDAQAYLAVGLKPILILHAELMKTSEDIHRWARDLAGLPEGVNVVESWEQVGQVFSGERFPPAKAVEMLRKLAVERAAAEETPGAVPAGSSSPSAAPQPARHGGGQ